MKVNILDHPKIIAYYKESFMNHMMWGVPFPNKETIAKWVEKNLSPEDILDFANQCKQQSKNEKK